MDAPKVSVLIPVFNTEKYIEEAIGSVLTQTFEDFELIIVDNHSNDATVEKIRPFLRDRRVSLHINETNIGMVGNWNRCLQYARAEYIKMLCADDKFHPELLKTFVKVLDSNNSVSLVTSPPALFGNLEKVFEPPHSSGIMDGRKALKLSLHTHNWLGAPTNPMFRKANLWVGHFNLGLQYIADWDMWLRHLAVGDLFVVPKILSYLRQHSDQGMNRIFRELIYIKEEYEYARYVLNAEHLFGKFSQHEKRRILKRKATQAFLSIPAALKRKRLDLVRDLLRLAYGEHVLISGASRLPLHLVQRLSRKGRDA
jgi:glycosyltransferase involved in cell wall biosynthesis